MTLPPLPKAVTTVGPCMFGGEPSVETPLYTADQMRAYAHLSLRCDAIPRHAWEQVGDETVNPYTGLCNGWRRCTVCGTRAHYTRDPNEGATS